MARFRVVDVSQDGTLVTLRDRTGAEHVGRVPAFTLKPEDEVTGPPPQYGSQMLMWTVAGAACQVLLEDIDCPPNVAFRRVHPESVAAFLRA